VSNTGNNNGVTIEVPEVRELDVSLENDAKVSSEDTVKRAGDDVWTDHSALIFDVDDRPPIYIAFAYALQVRSLDSI